MKRSTQVLAFCVLFAFAIVVNQGVAQVQRAPQAQRTPNYALNQWFLNQQQMRSNQVNWSQQLVNNNMATNAAATQYYGSTINPVTFPNIFPNYNYYGYGYGYGYPSAPYYPSYYPPVATPYGSVAAANPYVPTAPGYGANPYSPTDPYNPYNPYNPYYSGYGPGSVLTGSADVIRSYGQYINSQEQARITREKALQAQQETRKLIHDTDMYIEATTPTFTQRQEKIARSTLQRIQKNALPGEISNGKSLNLLLKDLLTFKGKSPPPMEPLPLGEPVLMQLNVTKSTYGMGVLRDAVNGKVAWPGAVSGLMPDKERQDLNKKLQTLVRDANNDRINKDALTDVRNEIERLREDLVAKVNDIPTTPYLEGKRFLQELYEATRALEQGEAVNQRAYQRWLEDGKNGRSVQELVDYMGKNALQFGPATTADEASYRAAYQGLANYDLAMNQQHAVEN